MIRFVLILSGSLGLAGCMQTKDQQMAADDAKCVSYGVPKGSQAYVQCRMLIDQQRADQRAINSTGAIGWLQNLSQPQ